MEAYVAGCSLELENVGTQLIAPLEQRFLGRRRVLIVVLFSNKKRISWRFSNRRPSFCVAVQPAGLSPGRGGESPSDAGGLGVLGCRGRERCSRPKACPEKKTNARAGTRRYGRYSLTVYDSEGGGNITGFQFFVLESEGSNNPKVAFDSLYTDSAANILCRRVQTEIFG